MKIYLPIFLFFLISSAYGQSNYRNFNSQYVKLINGVSSKEQELEAAISNYTPDMEKEENFELVFHVLESSGVINKDVIAEQIKILNIFFNATPRDKFFENDNLNFFYEKAQDPKIYFCDDPLIIANPQQKNFEVLETMTEEIMSLSKPIDGDNKINVWIADMPEANAGFAYGPRQHEVADGIFINTKYFGVHQNNNPLYSSGGTLVHLMATFLGLKELWNYYEYCADDKVEDTPIHNYPNFTTGEFLINTSTCDGSPKEMIVNIMDNLEDKYMQIFTKGQVARMKTIIQLENGRKNFMLDNCGNSSNRAAGFTHYNLFPNPNNGIFTINIEGTVQELVNIKIANALGKQVFEKNYTEMNRRIELSLFELPNGLYKLKCEDSMGNIKLINFVKLN
jgi:hypothetical protein